MSMKFSQAGKGGNEVSSIKEIYEGSSPPLVECKGLSEVLAELKARVPKINSYDFKPGAAEKVSQMFRQAGNRLLDIAEKGKDIVLSEDFARNLCVVLGTLGIGASAVATLGMPLVVGAAVALGAALLYMGAQLLYDRVEEYRNKPEKPSL